MTVVDIRNQVTDSSVELIEIGQDFIYYAEEKMEEGHNSLFILEYDRNEHRERIVANYILNDRSYTQHYFSFLHDIVIVMENGGSAAWVLRLEKDSGKEKNFAFIHFIGGFAGCCALDENHILFYTEENEEHKKLFREYKKLTGFPKIAYLYDIDDEVYYYIKDRRICTLSAENVVPFDLDGELQLLILQPYGDEKEKEHCYKNMRWMGDHINDNVWLCPLLDFLVSAKASEPAFPMELVLSAGTDGMVRYAGMDDQNLYFRAKHFPEDDMRVCAVEKQTGKKSVVAALNLDKEDERAGFYTDISAAKIYKVQKTSGGYHIKGVLNSQVDAEYSEELGTLVACVEDRFLIAQYIMSDEKDSFEFNSIYDVKTKEQKSYECRCAVKGSTVVLY